MTKISDIVIGERFRKDYGDLTGLQESIKNIGLLHSIVLQKDTNRLIAGARRLKALESLGYTELPESYIKWVDLDLVISGERDENLERLELTASEKVAVTKAAEEEMANRVKEHMMAKATEGGIKGGEYGELGSEYGKLGADHGKLGGRGISKETEEYERKKESFVAPSKNIELTASEKIAVTKSAEEEMAMGVDDKNPPPAEKFFRRGGVLDPSKVVLNDNGEFIEQDPTEQRDYQKDDIGRVKTKLAAMIGVSRPTYEKMEEIVDMATKDPENFGKFQEMLDAKDENGARVYSVDKVYKDMKAEIKKLAKPQYDPSVKLSLLANKPDRQLPSYVYAAMCAIPPDKQDELIDKYGGVLFMVQQSTYERGIKVISKGEGFAVLDEEQSYIILDDIFRTTVNIMNRWPLLDHCANINQTYMSIINAQGNNIDDWDKFEALFMSAAIGFKLAIAYQVKFVRSGEIDGSIQSSTKTRTNEEAIIDLKNISEGFSSVLEYAKDICTTRTAKRIKEMIGDDETDIMKKHGINVAEAATYLTEIENDIEHIIKKVETAMDKIMEDKK